MINFIAWNLHLSRSTRIFSNNICPNHSVFNQDTIWLYPSTTFLYFGPKKCLTIAGQGGTFNLICFIVRESKNTTNPKEFGERLQRLRIEKKLSQSELAKLVGMHPNQIGRYERGTSQPTAEKIKKLCEVLGVSHDYLLDGNLGDAARARFEDGELLELFKEIESMQDEDKTVVKKFLDAFVTKKRIHEMTSK